MRDDNSGTGGQWDDPMSKSGQGQGQGQWDQGGDNTGGGDTYGQQRAPQSAFGTDVGGGQTGTTGYGGPDTQSDQSSGQYGGQERFQTSQSQTAGYADPNRNVAGAGTGRQADDDDDYGSSGPGAQPSGGGKPSMTSRVKGAAEQMAGKVTGDKQGRGREREEGNF
jgi:hypothetical protein